MSSGPTGAIGTSGPGSTAGAPCKERLPGLDLGGRVGRTLVLRAERHEADVIRREGKALEERRGSDEEEAGATLLDEVGDLGRGARGVQGHGDASREPYRDIDREVARAVGADDTDPVAQA